MKNFHQLLLQKIIDNYINTDPLKNGSNFGIDEYRVSKETYVVFMKEIIGDFGLTEDVIKWLNDFDDEVQTLIFTSIYEDVISKKNTNYNDIDNLIKYYEKIEQYEICSKLFIIQKKIYE